MGAQRHEPVVFQDPPIARALFSDPRYAWVWLPVRLYLGYAWLDASLHKLGDPRWMVTGEAVKEFWQRQVQVPPSGRPPITYDWYRDFLLFLLQGGHWTWMAKLIAIGEFLVGVALILGAFVGIAAFFGAFMNMNFMLAGVVSTNPVLFTLAILLMLAWKTAGWWGLDRWLLPLLGTPWQPGAIFGYRPPFGPARASTA